MMSEERTRKEKLDRVGEAVDALRKQFPMSRGILVAVAEPTGKPGRFLTTHKYHGNVAEFVLIVSEVARQRPAVIPLVMSTLEQAAKRVKTEYKPSDTEDDGYHD